MSGTVLRAEGMRAGRCGDMAAGTVTLDGLNWGAWLPGSLLDHEPWPTGAPRVLAFTGSLSGSLDQGDLRNWMPAGIESCRSALGAARTRAQEHGQRLVIVPHALHLVSDLHSTLRLVREHQGIGVALAPAALLTASMLEHAADHLARILGTLGPIADAIILHDLARCVDQDGEPAVKACAWRGGVLDASLVASLLPPGIPVLTLDR